MDQHVETEYADFCALVAEEAAATVQGLGDGRTVGRRLKEHGDLVTEADLASDSVVRRRIGERFPDHRVVSEETWDGWREGLFDGPVWVVDPLDGTSNFAHGHPYWCVSVALAVDGVTVAGAVVAPQLGQVFRAARGAGATLNGEALTVARPATLAEAVVGTGVPHDRSDLDGPLARIRRLLTECRDIRRAGSPALDICYVAAGLLDAHCESLAPWDVAAAKLVAHEAGAVSVNLEPEPFPIPPDLAGTGVLVSSPTILDELRALLGSGG